MLSLLFLIHIEPLKRAIRTRLHIEAFREGAPDGVRNVISFFNELHDFRNELRRHLPAICCESHDVSGLLLKRCEFEALEKIILRSFRKQRSHPFFPTKVFERFIGGGPENNREGVDLQSIQLSVRAVGRRPDPFEKTFGSDLFINFSGEPGGIRSCLD